MRTLIPLALAAVAFAAGITFTAMSVRRPARGGTDPALVARRTVQAIISSDSYTYANLVQASPATEGFDPRKYPSLRDCEITDVQVPHDVVIAPITVAFRTPCGETTRPIPCVGVSLVRAKNRYYVSSLTGC